MSRQRINSLDGLRGIGACIIAFFFHYRHFENAGTPFKWIPGVGLLEHYGYLMVELFFLISGFVIALQYKEKILNGEIAFKEYIKKRIWHVWPLMFITLIVFAVLQTMYFCTAGELFVSDGLDLNHFIYNLFMIQSGWIEDAISLNGPAWCISVEILCYIIFYWCAYSGRRSKNSYICLCVAFVFLGLSLNIWKISLPFAAYRTVGRGYICFFEGAVLFELHNSLKAKARKKIGWLLLFSGLLVGIEVGILGTEALGSPEIAMSLYFAPILLWLAINMKGIRWVLELKPFRYLGKCSLSIYLWHFPLQCAICLIDRKFQLKLDYNSIEFFFSYCVIVIITASVSYLFIEKNQKKLVSKAASWILAD